MIRILVADDHPVVLSGLQAILNTQTDFEVIATAKNGEDAIKAADAHQPNIILIDLQMPVLDGLSAIRQIHQNHPSIKLLVLTTYDSEADILPAIEAGAAGYLLKDSPPETLFEAIRSTHRGSMVLSGNVAEKVARKLKQANTHELSLREIEVLNYAAQGKANKEIAASLHISEATVKTHLIHIFAKLGVTDRTAAVVEAIKHKIIRIYH
jgi:DNA-binding NarL/FixJ family response regulator